MHRQVVQYRCDGRRIQIENPLSGSERVLLALHNLRIHKQPLGNETADDMNKTFSVSDVNSCVEY